MKRIIILFAAICAIIINAAAQTVQCSIGEGATASRVKIYMKPISGTVTGQLSTVNLNVSIPETTPGPTPTLTISNNPYPTATFQINTAYVEGGYIHYNIANLNPFTVTGITAETELVEVEFAGLPAGTVVSSVTLPDGGGLGFALFYVTGAAATNGSNLYYTRAGTTVTNAFSYTPDPNFGNPPGTTNSLAVISSLLPVNWLSFNVTKQGSDAVLNWLVENENNTQYYYLQRSTNGTDFTTVGTVNKANAGNYTFTDTKIDILGAKLLYYRIKQTDYNGLVKYSDIRLLRLDLQGLDIAVFPNPVKEGFYVTVPGLTAGKIRLNLTANDGKTVAVREINSLQANNYYFDVKRHTLAAGQYNLQILQDGKILSNKKLYINQ